MIYTISPPSNLTGQVKNITESAPYYFDGTLWQTFSKEVAPIEYYIILTLDPNSTASLTATSVWSTPVNHWGNTNAYLTSSKYYTIGTQNFGGLKGSVSFRKNATTIDKRAIVGLIYPEKLIFDGENFQTTKINSFINSIFLIKRELWNEKNRPRSKKLLKSVL